MNASRVEFTKQGRRAPFFRAPDLASGSPWAGFSFEEADSPGEPLPSHSWSKTTLLYARGGRASLRWKHRGVWSHDPISGGTVSIVRRDVVIQSAIPSGSFPMMVLQLDPSRLAALAPDLTQAIDGSLVAVRVTQDLRLAALLSAMCAEVSDGCPSGRLFGESVSIALLAYLANRYAAPRDGAGRGCGLSPAEMRRLADYVRENLAHNISVTELAALVRMGPSKFARTFKAAFGVTPYQFVMRERVAVAKDLMAATKMPASWVATEVGFSSQSHFVKVFRQFTGATPKQFKAGY